MSEIKWIDIPEEFWPDVERPWRVTSGFGCFKDFDREFDAWKFYYTLVSDEAGEWKGISKPFNTVERSYGTA